MQFDALPPFIFFSTNCWACFVQ